MNTLILRRSDRYPYYFIIGNIDPVVLRTLRSELSFYVNGYERTTSYKDGRWDGRDVLIYRHRNGDFFIPIGLLARVTNVFNAFGVEYLIEDATEIPHDTLGLTRQSKLTLREYQRNAVESIFVNGGGVVALPTGAGKTIIALQIMYAYDLPALILVNTKELLEQWRQNIVEFFGYEPGVVGDGQREFKHITVAMVQTMYNIVSEENTDIDFPVLICDECHRVGAETIYKVAMNCYAAIRVGLSATVHRTDGADLKIWAALGEICANITPEELIDQGYLAKPNFIFERVPAARLSRSCKWNDAYTSLIVCNEVRNERIINWASRLVAKGYRTFISVNRIDHGEFLAGHIPGSVFLCGKNSTKERQDILKRFREGSLKCIISTLLSEGVDLPEMEAIILAGGGKSSILAIQRVGRALRTTPDKQDAIIIDFIDTGRFVANHSQSRLETFKEYYGKYCVLPGERKKKSGGGRNGRKHNAKPR
jgi:superfamily II DNA or RNA helicase